MARPLSNSIRMILVAALGLSVLYLLKSFLIAVITGLIFAAVLLPTYERSARIIHAPRLRCLVVLCLFMTTFLVPIGLIGYFGISALNTTLKNRDTKTALVAALTQDKNKTAEAPSWVESSPPLQKLMRHLPVPHDRAVEIAERASANASKVMLAKLQAFVAEVPNILISTLILLATIYFALVDGGKARRWITDRGLLENKNLAAISGAFMETSRSITLASAVTGLAQAACLVLPSLIFNAGNAAVIGLFTFGSSFLPAIGTAPVTLALVGWQALAGNMGAAGAFLAFGLFAAGIDNVIRPWICGGASGIHPFLVFLTVFGGIEVFGVYGLFVGPVLAATFLKALDVMVWARYTDALKDSHPSSQMGSGGLPPTPINRLFRRRNPEQRVQGPSASRQER